jgi:hypothetical protein
MYIHYDEPGGAPPPPERYGGGAARALAARGKVPGGLGQCLRVYGFSRQPLISKSFSILCPVLNRPLCAVWYNRQWQRGPIRNRHQRRPASDVAARCFFFIPFSTRSQVSNSEHFNASAASAP